MNSSDTTRLAADADAANAASANVVSANVVSANSAELVAATIASAPGPILPVGARTKPALSACDGQTTRLDMRNLTGVVSYDSSEFLISARAGTPLTELQAALDEERQYLPFDPLFVSQGATLGGTVASGLSGAGRLLYGSLRDFVMEVQLVDGLGKLVRGGGKVVKNAAGFDLPKLVVGSYGRLGVLTEVTLKVFPSPPAAATLQAESSNVPDAIAAVQALLSQPLPIASLDLQFERSDGVQIFARFAAHSASLPEVLNRAQAACRLPSECVYESPQELQLWRDRAADIEGLAGSSAKILVRIATTLPALAQLAPVLLSLSGARLHSTGGGSVVWLSLPTNSNLDQLDQLLKLQGLPAIVVCAPDHEANAALRPLGDCHWLAIARRIQQALDPHQKFVPFDTRPLPA
ncbi:MAG: FAD-binding protein [Pirellulaceae bacterium]|nr:FAD-binding protein [Pirellulaceae bacterium]